MLSKFKKHQFLFEELVKRDFKQKYKRTVLGMGWSLLSPLLQLLVMSIVFKQFFGRSMEHYTIYLFCGNLVYSYFKESTSGGMNSLMANRGIFSKVNVPKYMFLLSKNVSSLINFGIALLFLLLFMGCRSQLLAESRSDRGLRRGFGHRQLLGRYILHGMILLAFLLIIGCLHCYVADRWAVWIAEKLCL